MNDFIKVSLRGLIVTLLLPFIVLFLAISTVYCLIVYIIWLFRNIVIFFMGGSIDTLKEDEIAKKAMKEKTASETNFANALANIMHSAIKENPEAVKAMAQQEIASQHIKEQPQITQETLISSLPEPETVDVISEPTVSQQEDAEPEGQQEVINND